MGDEYVGEIRMFAGPFPPLNWAFCNGQLLLAEDYPDLSSLIKSTYGGDGVREFGLPDMRGRVPVHQGNGRGLTDRQLGMPFGHETVLITTETMPSHNHPLCAWRWRDSSTFRRSLIFND